MMAKTEIEWLVIRFIHNMSFFNNVRRLLCKEETFVVMIFVISPAWLIIYNVVRLNNHRVQRVAHLSKLNASFNLKVGMLLLIFLFECTAQVFLKLFLWGMEGIVRLQVREGFMELTHKYLIVCLAEVCVIVSSELIVAIDHVSDSAHHPLN